jgi:hypothetical protein
VTDKNIEAGQKLTTESGSRDLALMSFKSGWLYIRGSKPLFGQAQWRRRFFVLSTVGIISMKTPYD